MFQDVETLVNNEDLKPADPNGFALSIYFHSLPTCFLRHLHVDGLFF